MSYVRRKVGPARGLGGLRGVGLVVRGLFGLSGTVPRVLGLGPGGLRVQARLARVLVELLVGVIFLRERSDAPSRRGQGGVCVY